MEQELFRMIHSMLRRLGRRRVNRRFTYTDASILEVYLWAVLNDRPVVWACDPANWPPGLRRGPLPSQSRVSRRMRSAGVQRLLKRLECRAVRAGRATPLACVIDGKPLPIAGHSRDRQAGYGRAARGKAKGYKLHAVVDLTGVVWAWRVAPMNKDERVMARRLMRDMPGGCYLLADKNYDSNPSFAAAAQRGVQMVVPRRYGADRGLGRHAHDPSRLRSRDLLENTVCEFGRSLHAMRGAIERFFGSLVSRPGGLTCLPPWVRSHRRVSQWVQAKLITNALYAQRKQQLRHA